MPCIEQSPLPRPGLNGVALRHLLQLLWPGVSGHLHAAKQKTKSATEKTQSCYTCRRRRGYALRRVSRPAGAIVMKSDRRTGCRILRVPSPTAAFRSVGSCGMGGQQAALLGNLVCVCEYACGQY